MPKVKPQKYYAIKDGKNVKNIIVTSWKECSELVLGYNSIYKSFISEDEAKKYLNNISDKEIPAIKKQYKKSIEKSKKRKSTTKPLSGIRIPKELYEIINAKAEHDNVEIEKLIINALKIVFE
ncbi:RNase H1/viroplasmin domain-containing protein [uncultured Clostridium sp.]|uniref:RNase H1/viroplasmin domain-containing protein n=1 Tax=uncultured Clostridium sp. TaxID=59620 RepID=UPI00260E4769|nr:RNase H1/viroplasmin domain-containing protein [uncultured Clostridium sp.]